MKRGGLIYALSQMSERERGLLLILGVVVIPVAVVFLAVLPLLEARDAARRTADEAQAMLDWVSDQVRVLPADTLNSPDRSGSGAEPIGISGIEDSLVRIQLRPFVSQLANRSDGGVDLTIDEAPFDLLSTWLKETTQIWGYVLRAFRFEVASPGLVNATFELEPRQ